ncbi:MAG: aminoacyl-tRNA hydrolase [Deltaproteobacteria bacterium]
MAGLGNPGSKYESTRHNIGFLALDYLARRHDCSFADSKWQALCCKTLLWGKPALLLKPQTYMNESGRAVAPIASFFKIPPEKIIVVHDELDLPLGRVKIVIDRGAGGHNGIRSIIAELGTKHFCRIRAGIGRPEPPLSVTHFVLTSFAPHEESLVAEEMELIAEAIRLILETGVTGAMNRINAGS